MCENSRVNKNKVTITQKFTTREKLSCVCVFVFFFLAVRGLTKKSKMSGEEDVQRAKESETTILWNWNGIILLTLLSKNMKEVKELKVWKTKARRHENHRTNWRDEMEKWDSRDKARLLDGMMFARKVIRKIGCLIEKKNHFFSSPPRRFEGESIIDRFIVKSYIFVESF